MCSLQTSISSSIGTRRRRTPGSSVGDRGTASSTAPRLVSWLPGLCSVGRRLMSNSGSLASLTRDFERFQPALPRDFPSHLGDTSRITLAAQYLGRPLPHPIGKGSGQLSLNSGQLETDAEAGLAFAVLK